MILDEAHNIENELIGYVSFSVTKEMIEDACLILELKELNTKEEYQKELKNNIIP